MGKETLCSLLATKFQQIDTILPDLTRLTKLDQITQYKDVMWGASKVEVILLNIFLSKHSKWRT